MEAEKLKERNAIRNVLAFGIVFLLVLLVLTGIALNVSAKCPCEEKVITEPVIDEMEIKVQKTIEETNIIQNVKADYDNLDVIEANQFIDMNKDIILIDVRTQSEYESIHIPNSISIPLDQLVASLHTEQKVKDLDEDSCIFVYCKEGSRSVQVSDILVEYGYKNVINIEGGLDAWVKAGLEVISPTDEQSDNNANKIEHNNDKPDQDTEISTSSVETLGVTQVSLSSIIFLIFILGLIIVFFVIRIKIIHKVPENKDNSRKYQNRKKKRKRTLSIFLCVVIVTTTFAVIMPMNVSAGSTHPTPSIGASPSDGEFEPLTESGLDAAASGTETKMSGSPELTYQWVTDAAAYGEDGKTPFAIGQIEGHWYAPFHGYYIPFGAGAHVTNWPYLIKHKTNPSEVASVKIKVKYGVEATVEPTGYTMPRARAEVKVTDAFSTLARVELWTESSGVHYELFDQNHNENGVSITSSRNGILEFTINTPRHIYLDVVAGTSGDIGGGYADDQSGQAIADPYVYIDPEFERIDEFQIQTLKDDEAPYEDPSSWVTPEDTPFDMDADGYSKYEECDDRDPLVHPGAYERVDGKDNDCDGFIDLADTDWRAAWIGHSGSQEISRSYDINEIGQIVGERSLNSDLPKRAFLFPQDYSMMDLGTLGGDSSSANDINDQSYIVGSSNKYKFNEIESIYNNLENTVDNGRDIAVDSSGNYYVTGERYYATTGYDITTVKYDQTGTQQWVKTYNGPGDGIDYGYNVIVDQSDNIYVSGGSEGDGTGLDFVTIKYTPTGTEDWIARYDGPASNYDIVWDITVDSSGYVYVTGGSKGSGTNLDYATIKYSPTGVEEWVARYNGVGNYKDQAKAIAVDSSGNVFVTGNASDSLTKYDYATIKYTSTGTQDWVAKYDGPANHDDLAMLIALDKFDNVYVTGQSKGTGTSSAGYDYATISYDNSGNELWVKRYDGPGNDIDQPRGFAIDDQSGILYITGGSKGTDSDMDYATIAYDSYDGDEIWIKRYNGPSNGFDHAANLIIDTIGNIYVTGRSSGQGTSNDYATLAYHPSGKILWNKRYNGAANGDDRGRGLDVDSSGNVYVTGRSMGDGTNFDYATIKYQITREPDHAFLIVPDDTDSDGTPDKWYRDSNKDGSNELMIDLGTLGGEYSSARAINNLGQIVGESTTDSEDTHAFILTPEDIDTDGTPDVWYKDDDLDGVNDLMTDLEPLGGTFSSAYDINELSQVVGDSSTETGYTAFIWTQSGGMESIAPLTGDSCSRARGINDLGQVVGMSYICEQFFASRAFIWSESGGIQDLGTLGGNQVVAYDINNHGQVVGKSSLYKLGENAFIWTSETGMLDLETQLKDIRGGMMIMCILTHQKPCAYAINDFGWIVGEVCEFAALWLRPTNTPDGQDIMVQPIDYTTGTQPVTLTFDDVTEAGETSLVTYYDGPPLPSGFKLGDPPTYFYVDTTATFDGLIQICIDYSGISYNDESELKLFHYVDGEKEEVPTTIDTTNNIICGYVDSLSPFVIVEPNLSPTADAGGPYEDFEGLEIIFDASGSTDPNNDLLKYRWDFDNDGNWDTPYSTYSTATHTWNDDYSGSIKVEAYDGLETSVDTALIMVNNAAPTVESITAPIDPVQIGTTIEVSGTFNDLGTEDTHTATFNWGDDTSSAGSIDDYSVTGSHTYSNAGVYILTLTVSDEEDSGFLTYQYIVVYDPSAGFVTGGGWIDSPEGAYTPDTSLTGKATFGFVAKYKKGTTIPTGNTEFQFHAAGMNFHSEDYQWLVVAGARAQFKGTGTINGEGDYGFILTAIDAKLTKSTDVDLFRIKIWDKNTDTIVYDNLLGAEDDEGLDDTTELGSGSIVIHKR